MIIDKQKKKKKETTLKIWRERLEGVQINFHFKFYYYELDVLWLKLMQQMDTFMKFQFHAITHYSTGSPYYRFTFSKSNFTQLRLVNRIVICKQSSIM